MCEKKCKNIECQNDVLKKRVYCSLTCRNVFVNKNLRDYSKNGKALSGKEEYDKNPNMCLACKNNISYKNRNGKYCNSSCASSTSNKGRVVSDYTKKALSLKFSKNTKIKCKACDNLVLLNKRKLFCSSNCKKTYMQKHLEGFEKYKLNCKFNFHIGDYSSEFDFNLIKEHGWYKPTNRGNNLSGVSRDHIYSIKQGFVNNIPIEIISHPANCRLLIHTANFAKKDKCDITIEDLKQKIVNWDLKYKYSEVV